MSLAVEMVRLGVDMVLTGGAITTQPLIQRTKRPRVQGINAPLGVNPDTHLAACADVSTRPAATG